MNQQFQCTKLKDGLYIGNIVAAHDYQFLISNKFGFVVNCTAQIPNVFQHEHIRYLKFKLIQNKPHKLWDQTLKKLKKLQAFIQEAEQSALCCLVHSFHGQNRSLVFITGYLMKRYQWRLKKCLQFLKSKQIFIGLSNHYISQLQILQEILSKNSVLSFAWTPPYINQEEQILSKTYLNSLEGKQINKNVTLTHSIDSQNQKDKLKAGRRITWLDKLEKRRRKQEASIKKQQQLLKLKQKAITRLETVKHRIPQYDMRDPQLIKNLQYNSTKHLIQSQTVKKKDKDGKKRAKGILPNQEIQQQKVKDQKNIYQLTINNFISPNFNIINKTQPLLKKSKKEDKQKSEKLNDKQKKQHRPTSASKKSTQKINRAQSQKQVITLKQFKQIKQPKQSRYSQEMKNIKQTKQTMQIKENKQKKSLKQRDIKKELKRQIDKVEKQKSSHSASSLHLMHPLSTLAHQLIKNQQGNSIKRSITPTKKDKRRDIIK